MSEAILRCSSQTDVANDECIFRGAFRRGKFGNVLSHLHQQLQIFEDVVGNLRHKLEISEDV